MESPECACCHCPEVTVGAAAAKQNEPVFIGDPLTARQALGRLSCAERNREEVYGTNYDTARGEYLVWKLTECGLMAREVGWPSSWKLRCTSYFMRGKYWEKRGYSNPKLPDVVPPEGCIWDWDSDGTVFLRRIMPYKQERSTVTVDIPIGEHNRDTMLACCEAADPGMTSSMTLVDAMGYAQAMIPTKLQPGRYAISFRRLPEQVDYPLPERLP